MARLFTFSCVGALSVAQASRVFLRTDGTQTLCSHEVADEQPSDRCNSLVKLVTDINDDVRSVAVSLFHPTDPNCEEDGGFEKTMDPTNVFQDVKCCATAQAKVMQLEEKMKYCDERDICWKSLEKVLPKALEHYQDQEVKLCVTTTTTTTTATTTTTTAAATTTVSVTEKAANATKADADDDDGNDDDDDNDDNKTDTGVLDRDWCIKKCLKEKVDKVACGNLCDKVHKKVEKKVEKAMRSQAKDTEAKYEDKLAKAQTKVNKSCNETKD